MAGNGEQGERDALPDPVRPIIPAEQGSTWGRGTATMQTIDPGRLGRLPRARAKRLLVVAAAALLAAGCASTVTKHGHQFQDSDLQQVQPGMTADSVRNILGTPATQTTLGTGTVFYYISSTMSQAAFFTPTEIDRKVVAVYFTQAGMVERIANYGMKDGKVFDFISRTTPSANSREEGILRQLFRNLGRSGNLFGE
jgi:outer membrane protein assembly factor BamE (lipoprotein component of BamABCDE complex)